MLLQSQIFLLAELGFVSISLSMKGLWQYWWRLGAHRTEVMSTAELPAAGLSALLAALSPSAAPPFALMPQAAFDFIAPLLTPGRGKIPI